MKNKKLPEKPFTSFLVFTDHAQARLQQRGIARHWIPLIIEYGKRIYGHRGGVKYFMTRRLANKLIELMRAEYSVQQLEKIKGVYVVLSADKTTVITAAHKYKY